MQQKSYGQREEWEKQTKKTVAQIERDDEFIRQFIHNSWTKANGGYISFASYLATFDSKHFRFDRIPNAHYAFGLVLFSIALSLSLHLSLSRSLVSSSIRASVRCVGARMLPTFRHRFRKLVAISNVRWARISMAKTTTTPSSTSEGKCVRDLH